VASLAFIATAPQGEIPLVGASGAIAGILGAYLVSYPRARVVTVLFIFYFIRIARIPALYVLGFWFILQVFSGLPALGSSGSGGVAWFAHIGGFLFGLVVFKFFVKKIPTIYLAVR
jgi:membrane associated rhomboid family serine protease